MTPALIVLLGPTGIGKTELSLSLAGQFNAPILSSDSRQIYKEMQIGTAAPTAEQLKRARHYFVGDLELTEYYSAAQYETDVLIFLEEHFKNNKYALMTGGSMLYIDAVCKGMDDLPNISEEIRNKIAGIYQTEGLDPIRKELKMVDPVYYDQVDLNNPKRVIHALEVCLMTGKAYSQLRTNPRKKRPFEIIKIGLNRDRDELYERINKRVDAMVAEGLEEEARKLYPYRNLNALNTVGYKEMFAYFDQTYTRQEAIEKIKQNSRNYAKRQLTWFRRDQEITWFSPDDAESIIRHIENRSSY